jgi:hypothetical protein
VELRVVLRGVDVLLDLILQVQLRLQHGRDQRVVAAEERRWLRSVWVLMVCRLLLRRRLLRLLH